MNKMLLNNLIVAMFLGLAITVPMKSYFTAMMVLFVIFCILNYDHIRWEDVKEKMRKTNKDIWGGIVSFFACLFLSALLTLDKDDIGLTFSFFKSAMSMAMIYYMVMRFGSAQGCYWGICGASLIVFLYAFFQYIQNPNARIDSFYGNPNSFAIMLLLLIPCLYYIARNTRGAFRLLSVGECAAAFLFLVMTGSRGSLLGITIGMLISGGVILCHMKEKITAKRLKLCAVAFLVIAFLGGGVLYTIQSSRTGNAAMGGERIQMWEASVEMFRDHPLYGVGATKWNKEYAETYHRPGVIEIHIAFPHNMFMYFGACFGMIGLIGYLSYLILTVKGLYRSAKSFSNNDVTFSLLLLFVSFMVESCFDNTLNYKMVATLYFTCFGYLLSQYVSSPKVVSGDL